MPGNGYLDLSRRIRYSCSLIHLYWRTGRRGWGTWHSFLWLGTFLRKITRGWLGTWLYNFWRRVWSLSYLCGQIWPTRCFWEDFYFWQTLLIKNIGLKRMWPKDPMAIHFWRGRPWLTWQQFVWLSAEHLLSQLWPITSCLLGSFANWTVGRQNLMWDRFRLWQW